MPNCTTIKKTEKTQNHAEDLGLVCARNARAAKALKRDAARQKCLDVIDRAKTDIAARLKCEPGVCRGSDCVNPTRDDVAVTDATCDVEAIRVNPQPDPNPCGPRSAQFKTNALVSFTLTATCKCARRGQQGFFETDRPRTSTKRATKK